MEGEAGRPFGMLKDAAKGASGAALLCGCLLLSGSAGYLIGRSGEKPASVLSLHQRVPLEAYLTNPSFSEIEDTKARLKALCLEFLSDVRTRHDVSASGPLVEPFRRSPSYALDPQGAIEELCWGVDQFKGTASEMMVVQELLCLLKREKQGDKWLNVYLDALYRHPTDPIFVRHAKDALSFSQERQREDEFKEAFAFLRKLRPDLPKTGDALTSFPTSNRSGSPSARGTISSQAAQSTVHLVP